MIIYPAIDIRGGKCVRLVEGDFARETTFGDDPCAMAERWSSEGADWLHLVDLDGAREGSPQNFASIERIRQRVATKLQVGGGIRSASDAARYLDAGIDRIVLGTAAINDQTMIADLSIRWPGRIAVGLDARNGLLAGAGWLVQTEVPATTVAHALRNAGIDTFIYTDISKDGTLSGPNLTEIRSLVDQLEAGVIASGGVGSYSDIDAIRTTGAEGVIIGRALYDGRISLADVLSSTH
ncbi:1-(5-phosphoribosyl)-5-[(5-phosphoribosylamino)methylideneamino]imidazole-4-carboxamide isomerase [soil metagenome]